MDERIKTEDPTSPAGWYHTPTPPPTTIKHPQPHKDLRWSFCNNDSCATHLQSKFDNNHFPAISAAIASQPRMNEMCSCRQRYDPELEWVIRYQKLNPRKACKAWQKGKRVCYECKFLVNKESHEEWCGLWGWKPRTEMKTENPIATPNDKKQPTEEESNAPEQDSRSSNHTDIIRHHLPVIMITGAPEHEKVAINLSFYQTMDGPEQNPVPSDSRQAEECPPTPRSDPPEPRSSGHQQDPLDQPPLQETPRSFDEWHPHHKRRWYCGRLPIQTPPNRLPRRRPSPHSTFGLAGVSAWRGGLMSQRAHDMLLASAAPTASLWIFGITVATCYAVMR
jgi:hypothetical protein